MAEVIDGRTVDADVQADVCVIGGGAAGITVAMELDGSGLDVALVEAGGTTLDPEYQEIYRSTQVGLKTDPLQHNRWRVFGGTTGHWGGWCRPFDEVDFEARSWVPHSGWPFGRETLESDYERASKWCEVDWSYDARTWTSDADVERGLFQWDKRFENIVFQVSPPTRFGSRYRAELEASPNVRTYLHSSVVDFELDATGQTVVAAKVKNHAGRSFLVRAKKFVLAIGAVETARVLLNADGVHPNGLGNEHDLVGRFFMQHLEIRRLRWVANAESARARVGRGTHRDETGIAVRVARAAQENQQLLNQHFLVAGFDDTESDGVLDAVKKRYKSRRDLDAIDRAVQAVMVDVDRDTAPDQRGAVYYADLLERPEQAPNPASRLTLSDERDKLGQRRLVMDWRLTPLDLHSLRTCQTLFSRSVGARGHGRVRGWPEGYDPTTSPELLHGGHHHMGTARMNASPKQGVVDPNCRVHGVHNLWIAGSATFPTSGYANPTLTIVAMAVRVARALRSG